MSGESKGLKTPESDQSDFVMHVRAAIIAALLAAGPATAFALPQSKALAQSVRNAWQSNQGLPRNDGARSGDAVASPSSLPPYFYRTPWFYGLCVLGLIGIVSAAYRLRLQRAQTRELELMRLVEERTRQLQQANDHLQRLSYIDGLTNIPNRRHFEEVLELEWRRAFRTKTPIALLMLDIDHFKIYNDSFGHRAGDVALMRVAAILDECVQRAGDLVARYGGEEFAAILAGTDLTGATEVGERLRAAVEGLGIEQGGGDPKRVVTVSIGINVGIPGEAGSPELMLGAADKALYQAKRDGRNLVRVAPVARDAAAL